MFVAVLKVNVSEKLIAKLKKQMLDSDWLISYTWC